MRKFTLILCAILTLSAVSCGDTAPANDTTAVENGSDTTTVAAEAEYVYPKLDLGGEEFVILNTPQNYSFYSSLDFEEATGDALDDAVYERNRFLEEKFNFKLVINEDYAKEKAAPHLQTMIMAGDDVYDAVFTRDFWMQTLLTEGMLADLQEYDAFQFDKPWYDTAATEATRFGDGGEIFYAFTDASLVDFEGTVCVFFNERMMEDLSLELPYDLVKEGKWTLDKLGEYMAAGANLNGDDSFTWNAAGKSVYGMLGYEHTSDSLIVGANQDFFVHDEDNVPTLATSGDAFMTVAQKVVDMLQVDGEFQFLNVNQDPDHYEVAFKAGRSLLMTAQLKAANRYRDMEDSYGILPMPKYDETQEDYRCLRTYTYVLSVPVTCGSIDSTAIVMDAMSYLTYRDVMDDFYGGRISMKALRNDDSVEMLEIIRDSRYYDIGQAYGWSEKIKPVFRNAVKNKTDALASGIESVKGTIEESITSVMGMLAEN